MLLVVALQLLSLATAQLVAGPTSLAFTDISTGAVPAKTFSSCQVRLRIAARSLSLFWSLLTSFVSVNIVSFSRFVFFVVVRVFGFVLVRFATNRRVQFFVLVSGGASPATQLVKLYWSDASTYYDVQLEAPWSFKNGWLAVRNTPKRKKKK